MNEFLRAMLNWVAVFLGIIIGLFVLLNIYMHGFFIKYMRVKASRGKKLMVQVNTLVDKYLVMGHIEDNFLIYKKRNSKDKCRLTVPAGAVYKDLGINFIDVDESTNNIKVLVQPDYRVIEGHDAETTEALYIRCLNKPSMIDNKTKVIIALLVVVLVGLLVLGLFNFQIYKKITALNSV